MMTIETGLKADAYGGLGCYYTGKGVVPAGTLVWIFHEMYDLLIPNDTIAKLPAAKQEELKKYGYTNGENTGVWYNTDFGKHMNHDEYPNVVDDPQDNQRMVAARPIHPGDFLTCNYLALDPEMQHCGAFLKSF